MPRFHRPRLFSPLPLALLLVSLLPLPASAEVRDVEILFEPEVPTWQDEVTVTVRGESNCVALIDDTSVGFESGIGYLIRIELRETCIIDPPIFTAFEQTAELGRLGSRDYTVHLAPPEEPETVLAEDSLSVLFPADVEITPPAEPPSDTFRFTFTVSVFDSPCLAPRLEEVRDGVILVDYPTECPVLPPDATVVDQEIEVGPLDPGEYEIRVLRDFFDATDHVAHRTVRVYDEDLCVPSDTALCLASDRFRVEVDWMDFQGGTGQGQTVPLRDDTGLFWFFDPANIELTVKVLPACPVNGHYWVFVASGSNVEYEITVTDTLYDESRTYRNDLEQIPELIADTDAFATCP